jgi:hypothetical protein
MSLSNHREQRLDQLLESYKAACPDAEPGANFMPTLWQRIEARRNPVLQWVTMSRRLLAGAMALCVLLLVGMATAFTSSQFYQSTYVEVLDDSDAPEDLAAMHPVAMDLSADRAERR